MHKKHSHKGDTRPMAVSRSPPDLVVIHRIEIGVHEAAMDHTVHERPEPNLPRRGQSAPHFRGFGDRHGGGDDGDGDGDGGEGAGDGDVDGADEAGRGNGNGNGCGNGGSEDVSPEEATVEQAITDPQPQAAQSEENGPEYAGQGAGTLTAGSPPHASQPGTQYSQSAGEGKGKGKRTADASGDGEGRGPKSIKRARSNDPCSSSADSARRRGP